MAIYEIVQLADDTFVVRDMLTREIVAGPFVYRDGAETWAASNIDTLEGIPSLSVPWSK